MQESTPIDAVITWVDGSDPIHVQRRANAMHAYTGRALSTIPAGKDETRFTDNGELRYCITSIKRFAPWIRTIHLVTDNQCPDFLDAGTRRRLGINLVDHKTIFHGYEWALPTFNSITIETALHRIPGLAERYLYFNDDVLILQAVTQDEFFRGQRVVLRGEWRALQHFGPLRLWLSSALNHIAKKFMGINRAMSLLQQMRAARLAGMTKQYYKAPHVPHPLRVSTLDKYFDEHPDVFNENIRYPFRDTSQFVATFLANHLEIQSGTCDLISADDALMICFNRESPSNVAKKMKRLGNGKIKFFCLQSYEQASPEQRESMAKLLDEIIMGHNHSEGRHGLS